MTRLTRKRMRTNGHFLPDLALKRVSIQPRISSNSISKTSVELAGITPATAWLP